MGLWVLRSPAAGASGAPGTCVFVVRRRSSSALAGLVGFLLLLGVCLLHLPEPTEPTGPSGPLVSVTGTNRAVTLLIWTHPFGRRSPLPDCSALYRIHGCNLTDDGGAYRQADAVVIHHREIAQRTAELPPEPRPRAQKWIWMNYESPAHTRGLRRLEGTFNLTLSYRTDADIFVPYGYLLPSAGGGGGGGVGVVHRLRAPSRSRLLRPRLLAWVVSNWSESHARVAFYRQLRRYVRVDVFGRAGRRLPEDGGGGGGGGGSVVRLVGGYQFYLALENSQHTDYITEKLWNAVRAGAVPVVLGPPRQNYERFLPPEAFIHVDDFPSVRGLARYLLLLRRHPAQLRRHLDWRGRFGVHQPAFWAEHYCAACRAVRRTRGRTAVVRDLTGWFRS